jgi:hypothetical protein
MSSGIISSIHPHRIQKGTVYFRVFVDGGNRDADGSIIPSNHYPRACPSPAPPSSSRIKRIEPFRGSWHKRAWTKLSWLPR